MNSHLNYASKEIIFKLREKSISLRTLFKPAHYIKQMTTPPNHAQLPRLLKKYLWKKEIVATQNCDGKTCSLHLYKCT